VAAAGRPDSALLERGPATRYVTGGGDA
jgi:hypothetical protein